MRSVSFLTRDGSTWTFLLKQLFASCSKYATAGSWASMSAIHVLPVRDSLKTTIL